MSDNQATLTRNMALAATTAIALSLAIQTNPALAQTAAEGDTEPKPEESASEIYKKILEELNKLQEGKENQITAEGEIGQFEIDILTHRALSGVAEQFANGICSDPSSCANKKILVLGDSEVFSFGSSGFVAKSLNELWRAYPASKPAGDGLEVAAVDPGITATIAALDQLATLLRNERTIKAVTTTAVDEKMLVDAVAAALSAKKIEARVLGSSPGVLLSGKTIESDPKWTSSGQIALKTAILLALANKATTDSEEAWAKKFKAFYTEVTQADDGKESILAKAIQVDSLQEGLDGVLRLKLGSQGGTFTTHKNVGTTVLGLDPFRVTGGLSASYTLFNANAGEVSRPIMWGSMSCATDDMKLDAVRKTSFDSGSMAACSVHKKIGSWSY